ncbi:MAG: sel1 repeat family protein [Polyangiaceae bacterium]|nr:sel1 repeat family protein [Polyangiaceae bacterium]
MKNRDYRNIGFGAVVAAMAAGCGPGAAAEAIRPTDPSAAGALSEGGGDCHDVGSASEPLIVDWKPDQRGDLEIAMREGVAVVSYSCEGMKLLKDCRIEGNYGYMGMTRKEQMVRLQNSDEVKANLPLSGATIGGELSRGSTIDIALVMVGKSKTTWTTPTKDDLKGECGGATHFVRGATLGAFAMDTGTSAKVRATAEMFGASAGAGSASDKQVKNREGDLSDCAKATPTSEAPPAQCGSPIRLVLTPIAKQAPETPADAKPAEAGPAIDVADKACPKGLVLAEGKCTSPASAPAFQCDPDSVEECTAQCDKGHPGSCGALGALYASGRSVSRDHKKGAELLKKGCDGGDAKSCVNLGSLTADGLGVSQDAAAAATLFEKGCNDGEAFGCGLLGRAYLAGKGVSADPKRAAELLDKACDGGDDKACGAVAALYAEGKGVSQDGKRAAELYKRACDGSDGASCNELGKLYETGAAGRKDNIVAGMMYMRGCFRASGDACTNMARLEMAKPGGGNADEAKRSFQRGCTWRSEVGCAALKALYGENRVVIPNVQNTMQWRKSCDAGNTRDCATLGLVTVAGGNKQMGLSDLDRACMRGDAFACAAAKKLK